MKKFICHAEILISESYSDDDCDLLIDSMDLGYGLTMMIGSYDLLIGETSIVYKNTTPIQILPHFNKTLKEIEMQKTITKKLVHNE